MPCHQHEIREGSKLFVILAHSSRSFKASFHVSAECKNRWTGHFR